MSAKFSKKLRFLPSDTHTNVSTKRTSFDRLLNLQFMSFIQWVMYFWGIVKGREKSIDLFHSMRHCMKHLQIRSFFWPVFPVLDWIRGFTVYKSPYSVQKRENTNQEIQHFELLFFKINLNLVDQTKYLPT